jgi:hypothetical protein
MGALGTRTTSGLIAIGISVGFVFAATFESAGVASNEFHQELKAAKKIALQILGDARKKSDSKNDRKDYARARSALSGASVRTQKADVKGYCVRERMGRFIYVRFAYVDLKQPGIIVVCDRAQGFGTKGLAQILIHEGWHCTGSHDDAKANQVARGAMSDSGEGVQW